MLSYFYIIEFSLTGQYYAGSRYTKKLNERNIRNDLWQRYFTSSKVIKMLISTFGKDSFTIKKLKVFNNLHEAKIYETKFLKKIDAKNNPKMLNQSNSVFENAPELKWITNGVLSTMISKNKPIFPGFWAGRNTKVHKKSSKGNSLKNKTHVIDILTNDRMMIPKNEFDGSKHRRPNMAYNKDRIWVYDPISNKSKIIKHTDSIPDGWLRGNPRRKKTTWYHDPITQINYQLKDNDIPSPNLKKGRFYPFAWYTNPLTNDNLLCNIQDNPPEGYIRGRYISMKGHK